MFAPRSVLPEWVTSLPMQQQAVLILALRGPDGDPKHTSFKPLLRAYRGTVMRAAKLGRSLTLGENDSSFMTLHEFGDFKVWGNLVMTFLEDHADASVLHHYTHFMHGAEVLGYKHPETLFRDRWLRTYLAFVDRLHLLPEDEAAMDQRLRDWDQVYW